MFLWFVSCHSLRCFASLILVFLVNRCLDAKEKEKLLLFLHLLLFLLIMSVSLSLNLTHLLLFLFPKGLCRLGKNPLLHSLIPIVILLLLLLVLSAPHLCSMQCPLVYMFQWIKRVRVALWLCYKESILSPLVKCTAGTCLSSSPEYFGFCIPISVNSLCGCLCVVLYTSQVQVVSFIQSVDSLTWERERERKSKSRGKNIQLYYSWAPLF